MLRCTYIVLIHNNESNIAKLVDSLKKIVGNFRKEFIFVDDGSTDNSLNLLKAEVNDIPRTTIITQKCKDQVSV
ncbi:Glycosyltransferase family 2 N-terminal domain protein [Candidatus Megaera venefica]|uniref:Glycosyltransferase family 2 N-terminal domain protein n=1 Tax=Candidatus Megaera venefica TaxID=2055910 RepID=A0ABU5NF32_9RICK|nr:glycosyltransferase [Candidatus Megaera venefica]MEA0971755.1 Glycosyltransferase family 2 N-terminal domain protein [Candidatus Megaera venefica]